MPSTRRTLSCTGPIVALLCLISLAIPTIAHPTSGTRIFRTPTQYQLHVPEPNNGNTFAILPKPGQSKSACSEHLQTNAPSDQLSSGEPLFSPDSACTILQTSTSDTNSHSTYPVATLHDLTSQDNWAIDIFCTTHSNAPSAVDVQMLSSNLADAHRRMARCVDDRDERRTCTTLDAVGSGAVNYCKLVGPGQSASSPSSGHPCAVQSWVVAAVKVLCGMRFDNEEKAQGYGRINGVGEGGIVDVFGSRRLEW
ncbi:hypothetical protein BJ508DRAFT_418305 [Ascobolus immersus RN42]|uniref:Ecp2 effector protein domain-containing protein n=1 Tax=Ascobolus immersus RN42 TaxID=1160509 RepID=A0A3N4HML5_ASCIM|nr:hypothetical protein BJ508DRAFT_418305 [Ascobolus immersus RN42]